MAGLVSYVSSEDEGSLPSTPSNPPKASTIPSTLGQQQQQHQEDDSSNSPNTPTTTKADADADAIPDWIDDPSNETINPNNLSPYSFYRSQVRSETLPDPEYADFGVPASPSPSPSPPPSTAEDDEDGRRKRLGRKQRQELLTRQFRTFLKIKAAQADLPPASGAALATAPLAWRIGSISDEQDQHVESSDSSIPQDPNQAQLQQSQNEHQHHRRSKLTSSAGSHLNAKIAETPALWNPHLQFDPLKSIGVPQHDTYDSALPAHLAIPSAADWPTWAFSNGLRAVHEKMADAVAARKEKERKDKGKGRKDDGSAHPAPSDRKIEFVPAGGTILKRP